VVCSSCGTAVLEGAKFCLECGSALLQTCPTCGASHTPGQKFCAECGTGLGADATRAVPAAPVTAAPPALVTPLGVAELRLVSVLFVDLVGFTALSESRDAEDVRGLLGRYFESARTIVARHGGAIEKFIGDAVMAVWGAPVAREDDAERAVRAALEIVDAVGVFGAEVGAPDLRARAGVVTGQVAALENPGEGLVVGDRVNTASRVQSAATPGSVFVDEVTRQVTSAAIAFADAGEHSAKGKAEPLRLWRAVRVVAGVAGSEREQGLQAPFVGRDGDLRLVKELFHGALERRSARLVAISGEAGLGKSRLRREFFNYIDGLAGTVLWHAGRCLSYGEGVAYWALAEIVRQRLGIAEDASQEVAADKLAAGLERWVPDPADRAFLSPRLGALLGVVDPGLGREELFAGWRLFFERLAAHEPVVLVFEDMQWADTGLLEFIDQVLDWSASSPIFILTFARPELAGDHAGWPAGRRGATALTLEPLDDPAMHQLLAGVVEGLPPAAAGRIVARAQGVPLYAIETVRALADRGVLGETDGGLVLDGELGELDVPASLGALLAARLDALGPAERGLVKAMSVFGGAFPRSAAAALSDVAEDRLDGVLAGLVRRQVFTIRTDPLSPDRGQYAFAQNLLRVVAYEMLSRQERKPRHQAAAEHLRRVFANDGEEIAEVIASHYLDAYHAAGEDPDADELRADALAALRRAGQRAATVGAPETAERMFLTAAELAVDEAEQASLTAQAAEMVLQSGRHEAALELFETAAAAHQRAGRERDAARLTGRIGYALMRLGRVREATERIISALTVLEPEGSDPDVGALNASLGRALAFVGEYERAALALENALVIAQALELSEVLGEALTHRAQLHAQTGRMAEARLLFTGAIDIAERHHLSETLQWSLNSGGDLAMRFDLSEAAARFESALVLARRRGDRFSESRAAGNLMAAHLFTGRWDEINRLGTDLLHDNEDRPGLEDLHHRLAMLYALRGEKPAARASLERLTAWADSDDLESRGLCRAAHVIVLAGEGDHEQALHYAQQLVTHTPTTASGADESVRLAWPDALQGALALERRDDARALIALLGDQPTGHIAPYLRAQLARGKALLAIAEDRHDTVETHFAVAIDGLRTLGYPYWLAVTQTDLAAWLVDQGRGEEASAPLNEASAVFESLGAAPALARAQTIHSTTATATA
jgi:class 3 adenylate cyclase/tetratricopeptide (TPR) repeat protein